MGTIQSKAKYYYYNRKKKNLSKNIPSYKSRKNYKKRYFEKYPSNPDAIKVRHYRNGVEVFDVKPHYSYIYNGVPGGWHFN